VCSSKKSFLYRNIGPQAHKKTRNSYQFYILFFKKVHIFRKSQKKLFAKTKSSAFPFLHFLAKNDPFLDNLFWDPKQGYNNPVFDRSYLKSPKNVPNPYKTTHAGIGGFSRHAFWPFKITVFTPILRLWFIWAFIAGREVLRVLTHCVLVFYKWPFWIHCFQYI